MITFHHALKVDIIDPDHTESIGVGSSIDNDNRQWVCCLSIELLFT